MRVQRLVMPDGSGSWTVLDDRGEVIVPAEAFLAHLQALGRSPETVRTYAISLRLWREFLGGAGCGFDQATVDHAARFVSWLRAPAENVTVLEGGSGRCSPVTLNRHLAALFSFYDYQARNGVPLAQQLVAWRRSNRGGFRPFPHHAAGGRAAATRPLRVRQPRQVPRTLTDDQVLAIAGACEHLRDRFLVVLLAETGMRVGQALGLRHADFVSHRRELHIVPRADNASGARAKTLAPAVIPVSAGLVRLCTAYMFEEFGDCDSDYVFVNLFAEPRGAALRYQAVHKLAGAARAQRGRLHLAHAAPYPGDQPAARRRRYRGGGPAARPPLLGHDLADLCPPGHRRPARAADPLRRLGRPGAAVSAPATLRLASAASEAGGLCAAGAWRAGDLGVPARRGRDRVTFAGIEPAWLREALKRRARQRLASGCSFNTITTAVTALRRFSLFLGECTPQVITPEQISRPLIEQYLAWVTARPLADAGKNVARLFVRAFLNDNKRYGWLPIPADAVIYLDELSSRKRPLPRFLPEFVMAQLESDSSLARLAAPCRHLVVLITETGLRAGDACTLPSGTLITDSAGWPCLRVLVSKMGAEHLVPLSARAADAVRAQQADLARDFPAGTPWLFPSARDPRLPVAYSTLRGAFNAWQEHIGLHDEAGRPVHVTLHQLRHTFGTRLINSGVPQHVIQRLPCHASPEMTTFYAHLHDTAIRAESERYCQTRVGIDGKLPAFDPGAATADAEWVKHRLISLDKIITSLEARRRGAGTGDA